MGCAICLDTFGNDEDKRPTALACGHLFHHSCISTWFTFTSRSKKDTCPLCNTKTSPENVIKLYPSDHDDLDRYLHSRQTQRATSSSCQLDPVTQTQPLLNHDEADELLGLLLDFHHTVQSYIMAVHSVRLETTTKAGVKLDRLVRQLTTSNKFQDNQSNQLASALASLSHATETLVSATERYDSMTNDLQVRKTELDKREARLYKLETNCKKFLGHVEDRHTAVTIAKQKVSDKLTKLAKQADEQNNKEAVISKRCQDLDSRFQQLETERQQMAKDTQQKIDRIEKQSEQKVQQALQDLNVAMTAREEAEKERNAIVAKNNLLADQMRALQRQNKKYRLKLDQVHHHHHKVGGGGDGDGMVSKPTEESSTIDLTRTIKEPYPSGSSSPLQQSKQPSHLDGSRLSKKPRLSVPDSSLHVESEDLEDELQDHMFPMSGIPSRVLPLQQSQQQRGNPSVSFYKTLFGSTKTTNSSSSSSSSFFTTSSSSTSTSSKPTEWQPPWLKNSNGAGLVLGPKRRPKV